MQYLFIAVLIILDVPTQHLGQNTLQSTSCLAFSKMEYRVVFVKKHSAPFELLLQESMWPLLPQDVEYSKEACELPQTLFGVDVC